jgi:hypothetical protein
MKLPQIRQDRANHFIYGLLIFIISNLFLLDYVSLLIVVLVAIGKEIYDEWSYGGFDIIDFFYTIIPAVILTIINWLN